jgi:hypothetical protein
MALLACAAVATLTALVWPREREPEYNGKKLSEWLRLYKQPIGAIAPVTSEEAADAIRHIGTNALPFLLKWIEEDYDTPGVRTPMGMKLPQWREWIFSRVYVWSLQSPSRNFILERLAARQLRAARCVWGFIILGPQAGPAVPDLVRLARKQNGAGAQAATAVLGYLGRDALPELLVLAGDYQFRYRGEAMVALSQMSSLGTNAHPVVVFLLDTIQKDLTEYGAVDVVGRLGLESVACVPVLKACLASPVPFRRMFAAKSLEAFGAEARVAVPELRKLLDDSDHDVRWSATNALKVIAPEVLTNGMSKMD